MIIGFMIILMVLLLRKSIVPVNVICAVIVCGFIELFLSSFQAFSFLEEDLYYGKGGYVEQECDLLKTADLAYGERITSATPTPNIGMITGQNSDSVFMSAINTANKKLHEKLGMASNSNVEFDIRGASPLVNLIYNIRYGHGESEMIFSDVVPEGESEFYGLYKIKRLAGLGYMVKDSIKDWDIEDKNCFQVQNDFVKQAVGGQDVFTPAKVSVNCNDYLGNEYSPNEELSAAGLYEYTIDQPLKTEYDARRFEISIEEDMDLYMYYYSPNYLNIYVFIDDELKHADSRSFMQSTYHIGEMKKGQKVVVCTIVTSKTAYSGDNYIMDFMFGKFDENVYAGIYDELSRNVYNIEEETSEYIKGSIQVDDPGIMMTSIPADNNFDVFVDGEKKEYDVIGGALIGVPLGSGDHTVEFKYDEEGGSNIGTIVKYLAFAIYIILFAAGTVSRKKTIKTDI